MKHLKDLLSERALPYYIHQNQIEDRHPLKSDKVYTHNVYEAAAILVSERHDKSDLTDLVNALMCMIEEK